MKVNLCRFIPSISALRIDDISFVLLQLTILFIRCKIYYRHAGTSLDYRPVSYDEAMKLLKSGDIFGFFMIPRNFQADAAAGRETTITYYCNMAYFVPGTLSFKSFKQTAVTSSGGIAKVTLVSAGLSEDLVGTMLQPAGR